VLPEFTPPRVEVQTEALGPSAARARFPLEYHAEVLGDQADQRAAERRVLGVAAIAAVLVLLLMQAPFASWRPAAAVLLTLPAALVGGVVAVLALVPLAVRGAIPGHEIVQPMALVVLGSLVTATLLNLFVTSPST
jgi:multidrug efflux pump subunit AcrB